MLAAMSGRAVDNMSSHEMKTRLSDRLKYRLIAALGFWVVAGPVLCGTMDFESAHYAFALSREAPARR